MSFLDLNPFTDGTVTVGLRRRHIAVAIISRAGRAMPADGIGDNEPRDQDEVRPICRIDPVFDISRQKLTPVMQSSSSMSYLLVKALMVYLGEHL